MGTPTDTTRSAKFPRIGLAVLGVVAVAAVMIARRPEAKRVVASTASSVPVVVKPAIAAEPTAGQTASVGSTSRPTSPDARPVVRLPVLAAKAPEVLPSGWLNTPGNTAPDLAGKVVLYEFWTFGCYNCTNVLPYVKAWHERYERDGLVVLSIHTPEFDYEAKVANVQRFLTENDVRFPVALDPDRATWNRWNNRYWPNMFLHDRDGQRRYVHIGEGAYAETEDAIRSLLGVGSASPRSTTPT